MPSVGGKRAGAGRKPGSKNKTTALIAQRAAEQGITPLEVMVNAMRIAWKLSEEQGHRVLLNEHGDLISLNENLQTAVNWAAQAAPFIHPRLQTVAHGGSVDSKLTGKVIIEWGDGSS